MQKTFKELKADYNIKKKKLYKKYVINGIIKDVAGYDKELNVLEAEFIKEVTPLTRSKKRIPKL